MKMYDTGRSICFTSANQYESPKFNHFKPIWIINNIFRCRFWWKPGRNGPCKNGLGNGREVVQHSISDALRFWCYGNTANFPFRTWTYCGMFDSVCAVFRAKITPNLAVGTVFIPIPSQSKVPWNTRSENPAIFILYPVYLSIFGRHMMNWMVMSRDVLSSARIMRLLYSTFHPILNKGIQILGCPSYFALSCTN